MIGDYILLGGSVAAMLELGFWVATLYAIYRYNNRKDVKE